MEWEDYLDAVGYTEEELDLVLHFRSLSRENRQIVAGFIKSAADSAD